MTTLAKGARQMCAVRFTSVHKSKRISVLKTVLQSALCTADLARYLAFSICASAFGLSTHSHASLIYNDDFARANTSIVSNGWSELEADGNDIAIYGERMRLRDYINSGITNASITIATTGYQSIDISFDWQVLSSTEASDSFGLMVNDDTIWQTNLGTSGTFSQTVSLGDRANNQLLLTLSFWLDVNSRTESMYLDNIKVFGDSFDSGDISGDNNARDSVHSVPEPQTLSLGFLGFGILLTLRCRRQKKKALSQKYGFNAIN
jgi:hypothetical protein